jgi:isopenicillin N synthase-like dioxygenase
MPSTAELNQADPLANIAVIEAPSIDAADLLANEHGDIVEIVRAACSDVGYFYVDLAPSQCKPINASLFQMERFFALGDDDRRKRSVRQGDDGYGWVPKYTEPAYQPNTVSSLEAFDFGIRNVNGLDDNWPRLPNFQVDLTSCWRSYVELSEAILEVVARAAGMDRNFLVRNCDSRSLDTMRLLHYCEEATADHDREVGIAAHTDFECITLLYQTSAGLELLDTSGDWRNAPVHDGRIVVLLGDMLERWTNATFKATGHRVRNTPKQRFSIVMFIAANGDIEIAPQPQFISGSKPPAYAPTTQEKHIDDEIERATRNADAMSQENNLKR